MAMKQKPRRASRTLGATRERENVGTERRPNDTRSASTRRRRSPGAASLSGAYGY